MKKYPEEIAEYIASHVTGRTAQQLATELNTKFSEKYGMSFDKEKIRQYKHNHKLKSGLDGRFKPGNIPVNKGKPMSPEAYEKCKATMFKKGNVPKNRMEVGEYTHTTDGYMIQKVKESGTQRERFEFVHRRVWERHNGPIPDGKMVSFLDGDKDNCNIENLFLIDKRINAAMNKRKLRFKDSELTAIGYTAAKLRLAIKDRKEEVEQ